MIPLMREASYRFDFDSVRKVERIHLEGAQEGDVIGLFRNLNGHTGDLLLKGTVEKGGWAQLDSPLFTMPGDRFLVVIDPSSRKRLGPL